MLASLMKGIADNIEECVSREWLTLTRRIRKEAEAGNTDYEYVLKTANPEVIRILQDKLGAEGFGYQYAEGDALSGLVRTLKITWGN